MNIETISVYNSPYEETHFVVTVIVDDIEYVVIDWQMWGVVSYSVEKLGIESAIADEQIFYDDYFKDRWEMLEATKQ